MMELRPFQTQTHIDLQRAVADGNRALLLQAPTGSGKTVIAARVIQAAVEKGNRVMFFAHRRELVYQCSNKLEEFGVSHGMIMSGEFEDDWQGVQVSSIDTFRARFMRGSRSWPKARLLVVDEAHRSLAPTYLKVIERYLASGAVVLGLSATPIRADGKGLGHVYDKMIQTPGVQELIDMGYLVPPIHYAPTVPDLTGVKTSKGDYDEADLQEAMDQARLVGDVVSNWLRLAPHRPTLVFASGVAHSIHLRDEFLRAGVKAAHIDGTTPPHDRDRIIADLRNHAIQVVCNCMVLTEGFDEPSLGAIVLARPTKNFGLYLQMGGRGLRPAFGKENCYIIDHSGAVYRHGKINDPYRWTLDEGGTTEKETMRQQVVREKTTITCAKCAAIYEGQLICPQCGHTPERKGRFVMSRTGDLVAVEDASRPVNAREWRRYDKVKWFNQFLQLARDKGYKRNWAHYAFKDKFKEWPAPDFPEFDHVALEPEFNAFVRYLNIKRAKSREKDRADAAARNGYQERKRRDLNG